MKSDPKITISGSYRKHLERIRDAHEHATNLGLLVLRPKKIEVVNTAGWVRLAGDPADFTEAQQLQFDAIRESDALYVVNPGGYVGGSALAECGFARALRIPIWYMEPPYEEVALVMAEGVGSVDILARVLRDQEPDQAPSDTYILDLWIRDERVSVAGNHLETRVDGDWFWLMEDDLPLARRNLNDIEFRSDSQTPWIHSKLESLRNE